MSYNTADRKSNLAEIIKDLIIAKTVYNLKVKIDVILCKNENC